MTVKALPPTLPPAAFAAALRRLLAIPPAPPVIIAALSGGVDSVALLHLLAAWRRTLPAADKPRLIAAHLNHCLRGAAADGDQAFCREYAAALGLPLETTTENVAHFADTHRMGLEEAGRLLRQNFFQELAGPDGLVLTGHHAGDQVETILMRLRRGAHRRGLAGMREYTVLELEPGRRLRLGRPLLALERAEILAYALANKLAWREDATNAGRDFFRNRVRNHLVPLLENWLPGFGRRLRDRAEEWAAREEEMVLAAGELLAARRRRENGGCFFACSAAEGETGSGEREEIFRYAFRALYEGETAAPIQDGTILARIIGLVKTGRLGETVCLPAGLRVRREGDGLFFFRPDNVAAAEGAVELLLPEPPFCLSHAGLSIAAEYREGVPPPVEDRVNPAVEWLNLAAVRFPLSLRPPYPGERLRPLGGAGSRKIQDLLVDAKIPRRQRGLPRVLADAEGALWVWPLRLAERARVKEGGGPALRVVMVTE